RNADLAVFDEAIKAYGWVVLEDALPEEFIDEINDALPAAYEFRRWMQVNNGIGTNMAGTLHHLVEYGNFSLKFLEMKCCDSFIRHFLAGNYILNSLGAVINVKDTKPYLQLVHRDIRTFTGDLKLMIQMMVVLDDFTIENGATYFLSGSHKHDTKPDDQYFYDHADRLVAKKGSVVLFDSNLWHAAGKNNTDLQRRALTMAFTKPFFKQQLDYPRLLGYDIKEYLSDDLKQLLGYNSRVPANLDEYYQPLENRMYKQGQG
ncbi:MAG TPA: phytanoyl-CoA dioxygenase family protein, partial [Pedobacter sp.]|nr:phytanoyl-CoA dioxygenase family protein [Pedobacter sp.]